MNTKQGTIQFTQTNIQYLYKLIDLNNSYMKKNNSKWREISDELINRYKSTRVYLREFLTLKSLKGVMIFFYIDRIPTTYNKTMYLNKYIDYDIVMYPVELNKVWIYIWTNKCFIM